MISPMSIESHTPGGIRERLSRPTPESSPRFHLWRGRRGRDDFCRGRRCCRGRPFGNRGDHPWGGESDRRWFQHGGQQLRGNDGQSCRNGLLARAEEEREVRDIPEGEREEIRQIFSLKGFTGDQLDRAVEVITANPKVWVDTMMVEERGYSVAREEPVRAAAATFVAFVVVGFIPLSAFILDTVVPSVLHQPFVWSSVMTGIAFFVVGALKSRFVSQRWWLSGSETLVMGGSAAAIAYVIGAVLDNVVGCIDSERGRVAPSTREGWPYESSVE